MNKVDVLYSIGMKTSNNFVITAINNIIWRGVVNNEELGRSEVLASTDNTPNNLQLMSVEN